MYDALQKAGNKETVFVTYPELGHDCWDEAFSSMGLFGKMKVGLPLTLP